MRIALLSTAYPAYLEQKGDFDPLDSFQNQKQKFQYDSFGWADFWHKPLSGLGYEVLEIYSNVEPLGRAWARENNRKISNWKNDWLSITKSQLSDFKPEVIFVTEFASFPEVWIESLKSDIPSIRSLFAWCGSPISELDILRPYNAILSCVPEIVKKLKDKGLSCYHLNHAFEPALLDRVAAKSPRQPIGFSFVGQVSQTSEAHHGRKELLKHLVKNTDIEIYSPVIQFGIGEDLKVAAKNIIYRTTKRLKTLGAPKSFLASLPILQKTVDWKNLQESRRIKEIEAALRPAVFGLDMFQVLEKSKVTLNNHIDISKKSASNMRLFEATGMGSCLLTDWKENLKDLFEPDYEVVTYRSYDECVEKAKWLLSHPEKAAEIAKRGQKKTIHQHRFEDRAPELDRIIKQF